MESNKPLISVLLCVFNGERYLKESIESIINQTFKDWEMIAIDDGSNDRTLEILKTYALKDTRVKVYTQENIGLTKSLNKAINISNGKYLARQDADDISILNRFELQINEFEQDNKIALVTGGVEVVNIQGRHLVITNPPATYEEIKKTIFKLHNPFTHGSLMIKKSSLRRIGGYCEDFISSQDFDMIIRLSKSGKYKIIDDVIYKLRKHPESVTVKRWKNRFKYSFMFSKTIKSDYKEYKSFYFLLRYNFNLFLKILAFGFVSGKSYYYVYLGNLALMNGKRSKAIRYFYLSAKRTRFFLYGWYKYLKTKYTN